MSRWLGDSRNDPLNETIEINFETQLEISSEQRVLTSLNERGQGQDNNMSQEQGSIISVIPGAPHHNLVAHSVEHNNDPIRVKALKLQLTTS